MNRLPMEQREPTGPARLSSDGCFQQSAVGGRLHLPLEECVCVDLEDTSIPGEAVCVLALNSDRADQVPADCWPSQRRALIAHQQTDSLGLFKFIVGLTSTVVSCCTTGNGSS